MSGLGEISWLEEPSHTLLASLTWGSPTGAGVGKRHSQGIPGAQPPAQQAEGRGHRVCSGSLAPAVRQPLGARPRWPAGPRGPPPPHDTAESETRPAPAGWDPVPAVSPSQGVGGERMAGPGSSLSKECPSRPRVPLCPCPSQGHWCPPPSELCPVCEPPELPN